jgi:hypothetical protein
MAGNLLGPNGRINVNQTTTVQSIMDQLKLHTKLQNFFNVGGVNGQPALGIAERTNQMLLVRRLAWKFNRVNLGENNPFINPHFMISQQGFQDFKFAGASCFALIDNTTPGGVLPAGGAGVDLNPGVYQNGNAQVSYGPANYCTTQGGILGQAAGIVYNPSTGNLTVQFLDPHPFLGGNIGTTNILISGVTNPAFNSVFTYNQLNQTSQWTQHYQLVSIPDQFHIVLANNGGQQATITHISASGSVVTVTAANAFSLGDIMTFTGVATNSALNGKTVTLTSATSTQVTFALPAGVTIINGNDSGTIYAANGGAPGIFNFGWMESASFVDINNNSFPLPVTPIDAVHRIAPEYTSTGDNLSLSMEIDFGNGVLKFRLSEPVSTYPFAFNMVYQARAPKFTSGQSIFQWPDDLSYVILETCLWQGMRFAYGITAAETEAQMQVAMLALQNALSSEDREANEQAITPDFPLMR